jgi:HAD superfamily hydrolase (TIGR01549 family)
MSVSGQRARGVRNPIDPASRVYGVLFDVDGTLYRQEPLRRLMALQLLGWMLRAPIAAPRRIKALSAYRHAHESLRRAGRQDVAAAQIAAAAVATRLSTDSISAVVQEWMHERPLKHLRRLKATGLDPLLARLESAGVRLGVLSDYPASRKLQALDLADRFSPVLCSTDPAIDALKPNPRGFLLACAQWSLAPAEVLMVGDRADADAAGASASGMACVLISHGNGVTGSTPGCLVLPSFERLLDVLAD